MNVKLQSKDTEKLKFQGLVFHPANQKLFDVLHELQNLARSEFKVATQTIKEWSIFANLPPHLKKSKNKVHLQNCTHEQNALLVEKDL